MLLVVKFLQAQQYNKHFRRLITEAYPRYNETGSKIEKREIGIRIYLQIVKSGGRFLDAQGNPMNRSKAILKVMKALKVCPAQFGGDA